MPVAYSLKREAAMGILWAEAGNLPTENHHIVLISTAILHGRAVFFYSTEYHIFFPCPIRKILVPSLHFILCRSR